jgi:hypothetical protein
MDRWVRPAADVSAKMCRQFRCRGSLTPFNPGPVRECGASTRFFECLAPWGHRGPGSTGAKPVMMNYDRH